MSTRAELTLAAALRDATAARLDARHQAVRSLAPALLAELGIAGPAWRAASRHDRGAEVTAALRRALEDREPSIRGVAALGLGLLGDDDFVERFGEAIDGEGDDVFERECAAIALSYVGSSAPAGTPARTAAASRLRGALRSRHPDVRFQAGLGLIEVEGTDAETAVVEALRAEEHDEVRAQLVVALAHLDPPGPSACAALAEIVADTDEGPTDAGFEAALALAAARRREGVPRLRDALAHRDERDRALEGLAAIGRIDDVGAIQTVARLAHGFFVPGVTRVRAAYALCRIADEARAHEGDALLRRLALHPRPAVREAVADARAALAKLGE